MDLVASVNGLGDVMSGQWLFVAICALLLFLLYSQFGKRLGAVISDTFFMNWQLGLLALTGIVLSVASGWTTWDGMRNFTREPVLSGLITFGIQGVMLIVAWLIGESFATGMSHRPKHGALGTRSPTIRALQPIASSIAGILLFTAIGMLIYSSFMTSDLMHQAGIAADTPLLSKWTQLLIFAGPVVVLITLLIVNAGSDVVEDYMQSLRIMIRSAVLWFMFLACMATSVFFSFDSLFSTIFPASERQRAADLRAQNQVAGIVNDIGSLIASRRSAEQESLFQNPDWIRYSENLDLLAKVAGDAEDKLQAYMEKKLRERQTQLFRLQEDKSSAESQQVRLAQRKALFNAEAGRFKEQVARLAPEVTRLKSLVFEKDRELIAKKAEAEAEAGGIGITSKIGRGPKYREIKSQLDRLREEKKNLELQLSEFEKRLNEVRNGIAQAETASTQTDGEIAKLKSRSETANQMIAARAKQVNDVPSFDANRGLRQLSVTRDAFRREPTSVGLAQIQSMCGSIVTAMQSQVALIEQTRSIDCDPGPASEAASRVFALNAGLIAVRDNCIGGGKLPATGGADALFSFARRCVQDAGLPSRDTNALRQQINSVELNRDDKAHRFVVTTNAFQDGNKLAYLALAIAIAIDALVFMSGLFGANAVRSPLSDVPSHKGRSARQLEAVVENALLPDKFENAVLAIEAIQPTNSAPVQLGPGWTHEAVLRDGEIANRARILSVLNAGATIGAVRRDDVEPERYFVRSELLEFLNQVAKSAFENDQGKVKLAELRKIVTVALQPYISDHADIVLGHMHPISDKSGFTSEIYMSEVPADDVPIVQRSLNAGSTLDYVQRDGRKEERDRFYVHKEFYRTLAMISAENPKYGRRLTFGGHQSSGSHDVVEGRALAAPHAAEQSRPQTDQVSTEHTAKQAAGPAAEQATQPRVAPPPAAPAPTSEDGTADQASKGALRQQFLGQLIQSLGMEPQAYLQLSRNAFGPALATSEAFKEQRKLNELLDRYLQQRDRQAEKRVDGAYDQIASLLSGDDIAGEGQILDDARNEIEQNWPILMMLPNGPYEVLFGQMIESYEQDAANGVLPADKEILLQNARVIRETIVANPRDTADAWQRLESDLSRVAPDKGLDGAVVPIKLQRA